LPGGNQESNEVPHWGMTMSRSRFEPRICQIKFYSITAVPQSRLRPIVWYAFEVLSSGI
jgi:hypothetical protein